MTLEEFVKTLNSSAFWREFTFARNKFTPQPGQELELADNVVWLGDFAFVLQLKEREVPTDDPAAEATWFRKRVLGKATGQVRDTLRFLTEQPEIRIVNERDQAFDIRGRELTMIIKIVAYLAGEALPANWRRVRHHISRTAGFIHVIAAHDYLCVLDTLRVPEDIRRYFAYREQVAPRIKDPEVDESDIMGAFLWEEDIPSPRSREKLAGFVQDHEAFNLSPLIANLHDHIERSARPLNYYRIMLEFARVPRSVWREIKTRLALSLEAAQKGAFAQPYRLTFPQTGCTFMIAPFPPDVPATGAEGEMARTKGVRNLTYAAMYDAKVGKGVGIQISKDGEYFQIDWSLIESPWEPDPEMEARLANANPFRPASEKRLDSFFFVTGEPGNSENPQP